MEQNSILPSQPSLADEQPIKMTLTKMSKESTPTDDNTTVKFTFSDKHTNMEHTIKHTFKHIPIEAPVIDFKALKGYTEKEKKFKADIKREMIVESIKNVLASYAEAEKRYNVDIVLFVCQCVEDLINKPKLGALKLSIVKEICADFFDGKHELVEMVVNLIFGKIVKTSFYRRNSLRISRLTIEILKNVAHLIIGQVPLKV